ncbi:low temperature requirement protein A [Longimycelium tulufanense]|nr:low temperature requirement protein A [Longimycelium tulufanense]
MMSARGISPWYRPMAARNSSESHRPATPLELFFDLCFVVAVGQAAARLHHSVSEAHFGTGLVSYALVFFAIWWAWLNFTWFASAYDTDDGVYRVTTLVQIAGALILAAGVPPAFDQRDFTVITIGYVVMRLALVSQWLRAASTDVAGRRTALRYASGVSLVQIGWIARLGLPEPWGMVGFAVLVLGEFAVPVFAESARPTTWHPRHIAERYGLFTIIVLGELIIGTAFAMQSAIEETAVTAALLSVAASGLVMVFGMWWLYFDQPAHETLSSNRTAFVWGYGHYLIFASAAAVGAGLEVGIDFDTHQTHISPLAAGMAVAVPVALFLISVWGLHVRPHHRGPLLNSAFPLAAVLILVTPLTPLPLPLIALIVAALVGVNIATKPCDEAIQTS